MGYKGVIAVFVCPVFWGAYFYLNCIDSMNAYSMPKLSLKNSNAINPKKNLRLVNLS